MAYPKLRNAIWPLLLLGPGVAHAQNLVLSSQSITTADSGSSSTTGANGVVFYTGSPTANSTASATLSGHQVAAVQLTGSWAAILEFEVSSDNGTTWVPTPATQLGNFTSLTTITVGSSGTTGDGVFIVNAAGASNVRVRAMASEGVTGTASVKISPMVAEAVYPPQATASGLVISPNNLTLTQGSTTAGQGGSLVLCAATSGVPSYTTAQSDPLSCDVSGDLRITGAVSQTSGPWTVSLNTSPSLANGNGVVPTQGGSVLSATNGMYTNVLQGNAALSATNGLYANLLQGNAVLSATNPAPVEQSDGTNILGTTSHPVQVSIGSTSSNATAVNVAQTAGPWSMNLTQVGGSAIALGQAAGSASLPVVLNQDSLPASGSVSAADAVSSGVVGYNGINYIIGTPTANSSLSKTINGQALVGIQFLGTWAGTVAFEMSNDGGTTWVAAAAHQRGSGYYTGSVISSGTTGGDGIFDVFVGAKTTIRVRATAWTSGTLNVAWDIANLPGAVEVENPLRLTDGVNGVNVGVAPATTAATTSQPALVVALSPNTTGPVNVSQVGGSSVGTATTGVQKVGIVGSAGAALDSAAGSSAASAVTIQGISGGVAVPVTQSAATAGGMSGYHLAGGSAASTNATNVKNGAGQVYYIMASNPTTSIAYLRMYNTSSSPTCSASTNAVHDYAIGAASTTGLANGFSLQMPVGEVYSTGISFCLTGALGDTDTTNAPAGVTVDIGYK